MTFTYSVVSVHFGGFPWSCGRENYYDIISLFCLTMSNEDQIGLKITSRSEAKGLDQSDRTLRSKLNLEFGDPIVLISTYVIYVKWSETKKK